MLHLHSDNNAYIFNTTSMKTSNRICLLSPALAMVLCGGVLAQPVLKHRYSFAGEAGGTTVIDSVGGANGVLINGAGAGAEFTGDGKLNLFGSASATPGFVDMPNGMISGLSNVTIEAWVTWNGPAGNEWQRIFDFGSSSGGEGARGNGTTYLMLSPARGFGTKLAFELAVNPDTDPSKTVVVGPDQMVTGTEVHIALTYDPASGQAALYANGVLIGSGLTAVHQLSELQDFNCWLGQSQWAGDPPFNGQYNEFRIWEGILSDTEIAGHAAAGANQTFGGGQPALVINASGPDVNISWPTNGAAGFTLRSRTAIDSGAWTTVSPAPTVVNADYQVTLPHTNTARFFRLQNP